MTDTVLTLEQAARELMMHPESLRQLAKRGRFPAFQIGRCWRVRRDALAQWEREQIECRVKEEQTA